MDTPACGVGEVEALDVASSQLPVVRGQLLEDVLARSNFQSLVVYQLAEQLADVVWKVTTDWNQFAKDAVGKQLVRSADSIGANIAEGHGRGSFQDNRRFIKIARGSLNETQHWLRRAYRRDLLTQEHCEQVRQLLDELSPRLNAYLKSIGTRRPSTPPAGNERPEGGIDINNNNWPLATGNGPS